VTTCLFAAAFAAVDTVSQTVGRVQRAAGALLEGSFSPLRLLVATFARPEFQAMLERLHTRGDVDCVMAPAETAGELFAELGSA